MIKRDLSLERNWTFDPVLRPDGLSGFYRSPEERRARFEDRQVVPRHLISKFNQISIDYRATNARWKAQYHQYINPEMRYFLFLTASAISETKNDRFVLATDLYRDITEIDPDLPSVRSLQTWTNRCNGAGILSLQGGGEDGVDNLSQSAIWFTSAQLVRLKRACGVESDGGSLGMPFSTEMERRRISLPKA